MSENSQNLIKNIGGKIGAVGLAFIATFLMVLCQYFVIIGLEILGFNTNLYDGLTTVAYSIITIIVMWGLIMILSMILSDKREKFLKVGKLDWAQIGFTVIVAFGLMGLVNIYLISASAIAELIPDVMGNELDKYSESVDRYAEYEADVIPGWDHILEFIGVAFLVPIAEELTFRGAILGSLLKKFRPGVAIVLSACIFGILHGISIHIGYALLAGIVIGWVYYYTESIKATILLHSLFNLMGSALATFLSSGLFGDMEGVAGVVSSLSFLAELACIPPAIASFIFLRMLYKNKHSETPSSEEQDKDNEMAGEPESQGIKYV